MAVDLINDNTTRYYSVPDDASLTFPDSNWFFAIWTRVDDNTGTLFQYLFSNNNFQAANSLNLFLIEDSNASNPGKWNFVTDSTGAVASTVTGGDGKDRLLVLQRVGGNLEFYFCEPNGTATLETNTTFVGSAAIDGGVWNIGRRVDGNTGRYYEEHFGDVVKGSVALTQAQIELLARGVSPTLVTDPANLDVWFQFREASATTIDIIGGNVATRNGSGLLTSEHFPVIGNQYSFIPEVVSGRVMGSLAGSGGLAYHGGLAGRGGGLAGR